MVVGNCGVPRGLTLKISGGEELSAVRWNYQTRPLNLDVRQLSLELLPREALANRPSYTQKRLNCST